MRWVGGASVRLRKVGMFNVPKPCATLTVDRGTATLVVRPQAWSRRLPGHPWALRSGDTAEVFPVRATGLKRGVGFAPHGAKPYYFWCGRAQGKVLDALEAQGFTVDRDEHRPEYR